MGEDKKVPHGPKTATLAGFLISALDMEDEISASVYTDYLDRGNWPVELDDKTFEEIHKYLSVLLDDTRRHRQVFLDLMESLQKK